jgi:type I restriction enzyme M protein
MSKQRQGENEFHSYDYIKTELINKKGWDKNQLYIRQECLSIKPIENALGKANPDGLIEIDNNQYYVIEAKNERKKIDIALKEAKEDYADKINRKNKVQSLVITGIAGNDTEGYIAISQFYKNGQWETITENDSEITGLLSKKQVEDILKQQTAHLKDVEISEEEFLGRAENINEVLHENSINKDYRARFISAILLAMSDGKVIDVTQQCDVLIENINSRAKAILRTHNKLNFSNFIKIDEPSSPDNYVKVKEAIKRTYQELVSLNIRSAMNSGKDILGKFYEVFLKYGNGAKDIGIVLTPRHITRFVAEVLDINYKDLVLDPACGTGGFLVSAFDEVRKKTKDKNDFENFRLNGLYGIELQDSIISLAIVNMIFRRDGKNNMIEGNCFKKWLNAKSDGKKYCAEYLSDEKIDSKNNLIYYPNLNDKTEKMDRIAPITKVMMNPPFALKTGDEKEYKFIEHALKQMEEGGMLFSILPVSVMIEKSTKQWRKDLLKENTILSVIVFSTRFILSNGSPYSWDIYKKGSSS